jgi:anti-sigma regulatory factor (Ser/Thr protein kinase)
MMLTRNGYPRGMRLSFFPTVEAPGEARQGVAALGDRIDGESLDDLKAVISELVTLSVLRGASEPIEVSLELVDDEVEALFDDHGPAARAVARAKERKDVALPLRIIEAMVDEWEADPEEATVWFRMHVERLH